MRRATINSNYNSGKFEIFDKNETIGFYHFFQKA